MFKIVNINGQILEVSKWLKFYKYFPRSKNYAKVLEEYATHLRCDNGKLYLIQRETVGLDNTNPVKYIKISESEYNSLLPLLLANQVIYENTALKAVQDRKITDLKASCDNAIKAGISVRLKDNRIYDFELTLEDQLNLRRLDTELANNAKYGLYHAKGQSTRIFLADDLKLIIQTADKHIAYHSTYFNLLKYCIYNMTDAAVISAIQYGDMLPETKAQEMLKLVGGNL